MSAKIIAKSILNEVGGVSNIKEIDHCATRLRFILKDKTLVDKVKLISIQDVLDVEDNGKELQVVLGGKVTEVYIELGEMNLKLNIKVKENVYNECEEWRIALFVLNNIATNMYMFGMMYLANYVTGVAGLLVTVVGFLLTAMRIFDGFTDPIIGYFIDKTNGRFGKFRPYMIIGNIILAVASVVIYNTVHLVPNNMRLPYFILCYAVYIIGYTCQTACSKAGQACMTNNPKQRPKFGLYDPIYMVFLSTGFTLYVSNYLAPKYGGFSNPSLYSELIGVVVIMSAICTVLAVIGIWTKDKPEFFGLGGKAVEVKFKDYWPVLKGNRALQMLIVAACTDKIALNIAGNATVGIMLFGIVMGDFSLSGKIASIITIPNVLMVMVGTKYAQKLGQKKALVVGTWAAMIMYIFMAALLIFGDPTQIRLSNGGIMTIAFLGLYILGKGATSISGAFVMPMISDCADYETYLSGRFVPGMMGTLFSFIDKLISSFATTIVAVAVAAIGYTSTMPDVGDICTPQMTAMAIFLFAGVPIIGWIASLIAMKFYPLDKEKMEEVQTHIQKLRAKNKETA